MTLTTYEITFATGEIYRIADDTEFGLLAQTPYQIGPAASVSFQRSQPGEIRWASGVVTATDPVQRIGPRSVHLIELEELTLSASALATAI